jgi:peptidoglycan hydrolase-like protein with peptidoglycan-binding domain
MNDLAQMYIDAGLTPPTRFVGSTTEVTQQDVINTQNHIASLGGTAPDPGSTTTAPTSTSGEMLQSGSSGPAVRQLQEALKAAGFDPGPIDGVYGPLTEAAVRAFQSSVGISVDGIAGPITQSKLSGSTGGAAGINADNITMDIIRKWFNDAGVTIATPKNALPKMFLTLFKALLLGLSRLTRTPILVSAGLALPLTGAGVASPA